MQQQQCWLWRVWFVVPLQLPEPETSPHWRTSNTATRVHLYRLLHQIGTLPISTQFTKTKFSSFREYDRTEECSPHGTHVTPRPHHLCSRNYHTTGTTTKFFNVVMFQVLAVVMEPRITLATTNTVVIAFFLTNTTRKLSLLWRWHSGRQTIN
jgi:hypothetical protein